MRKGKEEQIVDFCKTNGIDLIGMRNMCKQNKTRIILTFRCKDCGIEYDMMWDNVKTQEFMGCCTKCAHKRSQDYRRLEAQKLIDKFAQYGYRVITPIDKIKPRGKGETLNKAVVTVEDRFGYQFDICYNNFHNRLNRYIKLNKDNNDYHCGVHTAEEIIRDYLTELAVPFKREFTFDDCRGQKGRLMRFDFCLYFTEPEKRMIIEIDERHHKSSVKVQQRDEIKNQYCEQHNIPMLRIEDKDVLNSENYKDKICRFINASPLRIQKKRIQ